jgi:predicted trehalose synthase
MKIRHRWRVERGAFSPRGIRWQPFAPGSTNRLWRGAGPSGDWLLKWYKYPRAGVHPEPEVGRFLGKCGFPGVPEFGARLDQAGAGGFETVAYIQRWVSGQAAWDVAVDALREGASLTVWATGLGRRVGALHSALATGGGPVGSAGSAFAVVPYSVQHHEQWVKRVSGVGQRLAEALRNAPPREVPSGAWEKARSVWLGGEVRWRERVESLRSLRVSGSCSRVHGDLHLGQILQTGRGVSESHWWVVDFEGEPLRPLEERRAPDLPLRDVAGMWRSFEYAVATAGVAPERARPLQEAFLEGWIERMSLPQDGWKGLLEGLVWEKAIYEALYEIEHRPGWLWIPLRALA